MRNGISEVCHYNNTLTTCSFQGKYLSFFLSDISEKDSILSQNICIELLIAHRDNHLIIGIVTIIIKEYKL